MATRLVDIDDDLLERAREALATTTIKDPVNRALEERGRYVATRWGSGTAGPT